MRTVVQDIWGRREHGPIYSVGWICLRPRDARDDVGEAGVMRRSRQETAYALRNTNALCENAVLYVLPTARMPS